MTLPSDRDERIGQFHASAQQLVWEWVKTSKVRVPLADTMDPLSSLSRAIVEQLEKTYQESQAPQEAPKPKGGITSLLGRFR
jgi:hypothetical protein